MAIILLAILGTVLVSPRETGIAGIDNFTDRFSYNLGLDLAGGARLTYQADMSQVDSGDQGEALSGLQDVIERRVNAFGVAEPKIQTVQSGNNYRLVVELAGIKDLGEAKEMIKETPFLEFKELGEPRDESDLTEEENQLIEEQITQIEDSNEEQRKKAQEVLEKALQGEDFAQLAEEYSEDTVSTEQGGDLDFFKRGIMTESFEETIFSEELGIDEIHPELVKSQFGYHIIKKTGQRGEGEEEEVKASHILFKTTESDQLRQAFLDQFLQGNFETTELTGKDLEGAQMVIQSQPGQITQPVVQLQFNSEGREKFKQITERNVSKPVAIFLDGQIISSPVVNSVIRDGKAEISGKFSVKEAKELAQRLNAGALPVPINLVSQESVEPSLGQNALEKSLRAGALGMAAVAIFMIFYYRLAGIAAVLALAFYALMMGSIFKFSSVSQITAITLTLSGIAGFILSLGMAVDANILIFERMSEEVARGRDLKKALKEAYKRAWTSIRDGNVSTLLTCGILMAFGSSFIQGFAIILGLGVLLSMFTAIVITRVFMELLLQISFVNKAPGLVIAPKRVRGYNRKRKRS